MRARAQDELAHETLPGDGEVLVRRIFSPDVRRIVAPKEVEPEQKKETPKKADNDEDAKEKKERLGLKRKELRKVVKPLQPGSPSKMLPSPAKVKAQMVREREEAQEEAERVARNEGKTYTKFSDRFEEEHEKIRRKAKDRKLAIAKAKRTRTHRGLLRASKGSL